VDKLQISARFPNISPANLGEFKKLAADALAITKNDPNALQYDWFLSADGTVCEVRETYANSDAVMAHIGAMGDLLGRIIELGGGIEVECFGSPSATLLEAAAAFNPKVYSFLQGK
jgi:hypothetical protein